MDDEKCTCYGCELPFKKNDGYIGNHEINLFYADVVMHGDWCSFLCMSKYIKSQLREMETMENV